MLQLPERVGVGHVVAVLMSARVPTPMATLTKHLTHCGFNAGHAAGITEELVQAGILRLVDAIAALDVCLDVVNTGREAERLREALSAEGIPVNVTDVSSLRRHRPAVLPGMVFPSPDVLFSLMDRHVVHVPYGVVDGHVVVGPVVVPGVTACLACADHLYAARDANWRSTRAQATARPDSPDDADLRLAVGFTGRFLRDSFIPWWLHTQERHLVARDRRDEERGASTTAARQREPIPDIVNQRWTVRPGALTIDSEAIPQAPGCVLCHAARSSGLAGVQRSR